MQIKSLKSIAEIIFFKWSRTFLSTKTVENIRISSSIVKTKNLTKSDSWQDLLKLLDVMCFEHFCQKDSYRFRQKILSQDFEDFRPY